MTASQIQALIDAEYATLLRLAANETASMSAAGRSAAFVQKRESLAFINDLETQLAQVNAGAIRPLVVRFGRASA